MNKFITNIYLSIGERNHNIGRKPLYEICLVFSNAWQTIRIHAQGQQNNSYIGILRNTKMSEFRGHFKKKMSKYSWTVEW